VGTAPTITPGEYIESACCWVTDRTHGLQFKTTQLRVVPPTTLVRIYATVRHFARWLHRKFPSLFPLGCPTDGVKPPAEPTPDWQGLTRLDEIRLHAAAQTLRVRPGHGTDQGLRNHALLAVLLGSGLRVSEVLSLDRDHYTGKGFERVLVKGGDMRDFVPVQREARKVLDDWLEERGIRPLPSLPPAPAGGCHDGKRPRSSSALPPRRMSSSWTKKK
jgi:site-specific recombinase XerC